MRWIVNYFRSLFCKHDWEYIADITIKEYGYNVVTGHKRVYRCTKCGYVQNVYL